MIRKSLKTRVSKHASACPGDSEKSLGCGSIFTYLSWLCGLERRERRSDKFHPVSRTPYVTDKELISMIAYQDDRSCECKELVYWAGNLGDGGEGRSCVCGRSGDGEYLKTVPRM